MKQYEKEINEYELGLYLFIEGMYKKNQYPQHIKDILKDLEIALYNDLTLDHEIDSDYENIVIIKRATVND